ncbi:MAG: hypothetical protein ACOZB0_00740 [Pseudomonadota bacterium]
MPVPRHVLAIVLPLLLAACAQPGPVDGAMAHAGWTLTLNRPLSIGPGEASARLQYGRIVPRNGVQETDPYCILDIDTVSDHPQEVAPGRFTVTAIRLREESFGGMPAFPWHAMGRGLGRDHGPSQIYFITEFKLRAAHQAGIRQLACQSDQGAAGVGIPRHLTPGEIRQALGEYFTLSPDD